MAILQEATRSRRRPVRAFVRHYVEMVVAMLLGMAALYPLWAIATGAAVEESWVKRTEIEMLVMATSMTVPMVAWMLHRGHGILPVVEMSAAMYAGFVVLFPLLWAGTLDEMGVMMWGHVLMPVLMLVAMLARREEYAHPC
jgi:hypothetical protein